MGEVHTDRQVSLNTCAHSYMHSHSLKNTHTHSGHITGGKLKTTAEADKESLQAGWFSADVKKLQNEVQLRAGDILPLVKLSGEWYKKRPFVGLPSLVGHVSQSLRLIMILKTSDSVSVLMRRNKAEGSSSVLPVVMCSSKRIDPVIKVRLWMWHHEIVSIVMQFTPDACIAVMWLRWYIYHPWCNLNGTSWETNWCS